MVSDDQVEAALDYLRDSAGKAAQARADRIYVEEFLRVLKSQIMREHIDQSLGAQEREAYADLRYGAHLQAIREAIEKDEYIRFMRVAAEAKIEAWRSFSANNRKGI